MQKFSYNKIGGLNATFNLVDANGKFYYNVNASSSFYVDTPEVDEFGSNFAGEYAEFFNNSAPTIDVRTKDGNPWLVFGLIDESQFPDGVIPGIAWVAEVTPTLYAGGQIAFMQLVNVHCEFGFQDDSRAAKSTHGQFYLDTQFPYASGPVNSPLVSDDSPGIQLENPNEVVSPIFAQMDEDRFKTYLMYQPSGNDSIWVSLSMLMWYWEGAAAKLNGTWEVLTHLCDYDATSSDVTNVLPTWKGNVENLKWEVI